MAPPPGWIVAAAPALRLMSVPVVAIVGRPNVGKSALFNRLVGRRVAIVEDMPGVTRDRLYGEATWRSRNFTLVDTGGLQPPERGGLRDHIHRQIDEALEEADVILLVVDGKEGLHGLDSDVALQLRRTGKPILLVANKVDGPAREATVAEFYSLGLGDPMGVSSLHGLGTGDLLDRIVAALPPEDPLTAVAPTVSVVLVGRPNVGKSSLLNALCGAERSIVHDAPGTTRDAVDTLVTVGDQTYRFIDTAGLRRRGEKGEAVEYFSAHRAKEAIEHADVALLVLDASDEVVAQDRRVAGLVTDAGKACLIVANKWDLVDGSLRNGSLAQSRFRDTLRGSLEFLEYAPVQFVSAVRGFGVADLLPAIGRVAGEYTRHVPTPVVNRVLQEAFAHTPPPAHAGKNLRLYYAVQGAAKPPTFVLHVNSAKLAQVSYRRYLENRIRAAFGFEGSPLHVIFRTSKGRSEGKRR